MSLDLARLSNRALRSEAKHWQLVYERLHRKHDAIARWEESGLAELESARLANTEPRPHLRRDLRQSSSARAHLEWYMQATRAKLVAALTEQRARQDTREAEAEQQRSLFIGPKKPIFSDPDDSPYAPDPPRALSLVPRTRRRRQA